MTIESIGVILHAIRVMSFQLAKLSDLHLKLALTELDGFLEIIDLVFTSTIAVFVFFVSVKLHKVFTKQLTNVVFIAYSDSRTAVRLRIGNCR